MKRFFALAFLLAFAASPAQAMTTPILIANANQGPSTTQISYVPLTALGADNFPNADTRNTPMPISGTLSRLYIKIPTLITSGAYNAVLYKNGVPQSLAVTVDSSSGFTVVDTTHTVSVTAGDLVYIRITPTSPSPQPARMSIGLVLDGTTDGESAVFTGTGNFPNSVVRYTGIGLETGVSTVDANASTVMPTSGTFDNFYMSLTSSPGTGKFYDYVLMKNGVATSLTCRLQDLNTTCNDTNPAHAVTAAAGDTFSVRSTPSGAPNTGTFMSGMRFKPTINGESLMLTTSDNQSTTVTNYAYTAGYNGSIATEANVAAVAPIAFTWKKLYLKFNTAPGSGKSRTFTSRLNGSSGALTIAVADTATSNVDSTHNISVVAGDTLNWISIPSGTPTASSNYRTSAVMYIAPATAALSGLVNSMFGIFGGSLRIVGGKVLFR